MKLGLFDHQVGDIRHSTGEKKVYTITSDGEQMLRKWVQDSSAAPQTPKDEFRLRLFFSLTVPLQIIADSSWRTDWHSIGSAWNGSRRIKTSLMESRLRMTKRSTTIWFC